MKEEIITPIIIIAYYDLQNINTQNKFSIPKDDSVLSFLQSIAATFSVDNLDSIVDLEAIDKEYYVLLEKDHKLSIIPLTSHSHYYQYGWLESGFMPSYMEIFPSSPSNYLSVFQHPKRFGSILSLLSELFEFPFLFVEYYQLICDRIDKIPEFIAPKYCFLFNKI